MYINEKYENSNLNNITIEINIFYTTIKIIIILNLLFQVFPFLYKERSQTEEQKNIEPNNLGTFPTKDIKNKIKNKNNLFIKNYLSSIPSKYQTEKTREKTLLESYFLLKHFGKDNKANLEIKKEMLDKIFMFYKKNIKKINKLFVTKPIALGNTLICLNNIIYYCEVLGCKNIFLNSEFNWHIKDKIISNKTSISLLPTSKINCNGSKTLCIPFEGGLCLNPLIVKPKIRLNILKDEIKRNLPKVNVHPNDLYIHIRCGNIFIDDFNPSYSQPPLCFYQKILKNFKFRDIYIVAGNNNSPVISKLVNEFPNVYYRNNSLEYDFALLCNAYNLVGSVSSFLLSAIKLNNNLKNYWEYDIYRKSEKFLHLHHDIYKLPRRFTIYKMKPTKKYKNEMFVWKNEKNQLKLMIKENCINSKFIVEKK